MIRLHNILIKIRPIKKLIFVFLALVVLLSQDKLLCFFCVNIHIQSINDINVYNKCYILVTIRIIRIIVLLC